VDRCVVLSDILTKRIFFKDDDIVRFCISSSCIFQTTWKYFNLYWSKFLAIDDDCSIVLSVKNTDSSILFAPIGDIFSSLHNSRDWKGLVLSQSLELWNEGKKSF